MKPTTGKKKVAYLLVGVPELVLQYGVAVGQRLHLVGERIERLDQRLRELLVIIHAVARRGILVAWPWCQDTDQELGREVMGTARETRKINLVTAWLSNPIRLLPAVAVSSCPTAVS
jgi:hypothetical protein